MVNKQNDGQKQQQPNANANSNEGGANEQKKEEIKVKVGDRELTPQEIEQEIARVKELEAEINKKYIELGNVQKELEPVVQLQRYLAENPDKAAKIADILEGKESKDEKFETDIPEVKKLKEEIDKLKETIAQTTTMVNQKDKIKEEQEFLATEAKKLQDKYEDLDEEVLYAKLLAIPNIGSLSRAQVSDLMDKIAAQIDSKIKEKKQRYIAAYLQKKEEAEKNTAGEGKGGTSGGQKEEIKNIRVSDGSAKAKALEYLKKMGITK